MSVYAFFEITLKPNPTPEAQAAYETYRAQVPALIEKFGGTYLARAWNGEALEGAAAGDRFHLIEFPTADAARTYWMSEEYRAISGLRGDAVDVRAVLIEPPQ
jgi:uncharacterized protein (DUF1330 family)